MNKAPDIEALFKFNGTRKHPAANGYRPAHLVADGCLTTGIHHYYEVDSVMPSGTAKGTIKFISPEYYPNCLWIGKKISIQEGERVVGHAIVTRIFNNILENKKNTLFIKLLVSVLKCAKKEKNNIINGKTSQWTLKELTDVIIPETSKLLLFAYKGEINCLPNNYKSLLLTHMLNDSTKDLSHTELDKSIISLKTFYDSI